MPPEVPALEQIRHVHLVAIAGTGMGTLATMLADRGFSVTGSDREAYPPMSEQLSAAGIPVYKGFAAEHVLTQRPDLVVIGNAVHSDNPEARAALESAVPYMSFPDAVHHFFLRGKHSVVVAGTHGKTTCTSLLGWILTHAGLDPSILIGGVAKNLDSSFRLGEGPHFVIEGDEYDTAYFDKTPKFLHYAPRSVLITSCEFDHADIYGSIDDVKDAFRSLAALVPSDGRIVAAADDENVRDILTGTRASIVGYGFTEAAVWRVSDVTFDPRGTSFSVWEGQERHCRVRVPIFGRHNVENCLGAIAMARHLGVDPSVAAEALSEFKGVRRRQDERGEAGGVVVVDDFAHHPTAVYGTISAIRARYPGRTLWAVFEPRTQTTRRRIFEEALGEALAGADRVVMAGVYQPDQIPEAERMRPERVVEALRERKVDAEYLPDVDAIVEHIARGRTGNDVALIMSNGGFGGIWDQLLTRLRTAKEE
ncbi:MAG: UDP-N-acetylmuramate:L-alanyl-gamma-D-glutamyl-meso-diaminopimelate ligase [Myxococcota bacterium]